MRFRPAFLDNRKRLRKTLTAETKPFLLCIWQCHDSYYTIFRIFVNRKVLKSTRRFIQFSTTVAVAFRLEDGAERFLFRLTIARLYLNVYKYRSPAQPINPEKN